MKIKYYQVGGSIRDELLGEVSKDIDYAVVAPSFVEMLEDLNNKGAEVYLADERANLVRAKWNGVAADFKLAPHGLFADLRLRDFSMNAMAKDETGGIIDAHGGKQACFFRIISCVKTAEECFNYDALRMIRALRFSITKKMVLTTDIRNLLHDKEFFAPRLDGVKIERIQQELSKCFKYDTAITLNTLYLYPDLRRYLFEYKEGVMWLKPTLEFR